MKSVLLVCFFAATSTFAIDGIKLLPLTCGTTAASTDFITLGVKRKSTIYAAILSAAADSKAPRACRDGGIRIIQLTDQGKVDSTFADQGLLIPQGISSQADLTRIHILQDQSFYLTGVREYFSNDMAVFKFLKDGSYDRSFAGAGRKYINWNENPDLADSLLLENGNLLLAGANGMGANFGDPDWAVAQLSPSGMLDGHFGNGGRKQYDFSGPHFEGASRIRQDHKNRYLLAGELYPSTFQIIRILENGSLDSSFGWNGAIQSTDPFFSRQGQDIQPLPDGSFLHLTISDHQRLFLTKYSEQGQVQKIFANNGVFSYPIEASEKYSYKPYMGVISSGKIYIAFENTEPAAPHQAFIEVLRLQPNGQIDTQFGIQGRIKLQISPVTNLHSFYLDEEGLLIAGVTGTHYQDTTAFVGKFDSQGTPDAQFGK